MQNPARHKGVFVPGAGMRVTLGYIQKVGALVDDAERVSRGDKQSAGQQDTQTCLHPLSLPVLRSGPAKHMLLSPASGGDKTAHVQAGWSCCQHTTMHRQLLMLPGAQMHTPPHTNCSTSGQHVSVASCVWCCAAASVHAAAFTACCQPVHCWYELAGLWWRGRRPAVSCASRRWHWRSTAASTALLQLP